MSGPLVRGCRVCEEAFTVAPGRNAVVVDRLRGEVHERCRACSYCNGLGGVWGGGIYAPRRRCLICEGSGLRGEPCTCARHDDGTTTTILCSAHAEADPCQTTAAVTGRRRKGSIVRGVCSACGWAAVAVAR